MSVAKFRPDSAGTTKKQCIVVQYFQDDQPHASIARPKSRMQVAHLYLKRSSFSRSESRLSQHSNAENEADSDTDDNSGVCLRSLQIEDSNGLKYRNESSFCELNKDNHGRDKSSHADAFSSKSSPAIDVQDTESSDKIKSISSFDFQYNSYLRDSSRLTRPYTSSVYHPRHSWTENNKTTKSVGHVTPRRVSHSGKARSKTPGVGDSTATMVTVGKAGYYRTKSAFDQ